jgi:uroporphyrinogen-III synthase
MATLSRATTQSERTLSGLRVAITRAAEEPNSPATYLHELGAEVLHYPSLHAMPLQDNTALDAALQEAAAGRFAWLMMVTASTVFALADRLRAMGMPNHSLEHVPVAAFGSNTRLAAAEVMRAAVERVIDADTVEALVAALPLHAGDRVLLLQADSAKPRLAAQLSSRGADVTALAAYHPVVAQGGDAVPAMLWAGVIDAITFTSEANIRYFAKRLNYEGGSLAMLDDVCVACLDPHTADVARELGLHVRLVADRHTPEGLAQALADHFAPR